MCSLVCLVSEFLFKLPIFNVLFGPTRDISVKNLGGRGCWTIDSKTQTCTLDHRYLPRGSSTHSLQLSCRPDRLLAPSRNWLWADDAHRGPHSADHSVTMQKYKVDVRSGQCLRKCTPYFTLLSPSNTYCMVYVKLMHVGTPHNVQYMSSSCTAPSRDVDYK